MGNENHEWSFVDKWHKQGFEAKLSIMQVRNGRHLLDWSRVHDGEK